MRRGCCQKSKQKHPKRSKSQEAKESEIKAIDSTIDKNNILIGKYERQIKDHLIPKVEELRNDKMNQTSERYQKKLDSVKQTVADFKSDNIKLLQKKEKILKSLEKYDGKQTEGSSTFNPNLMHGSENPNSLSNFFTNSEKEVEKAMKPVVSRYKIETENITILKDINVGLKQSDREYINSDLTVSRKMNDLLASNIKYDNLLNANSRPYSEEEIIKTKKDVQEMFNLN